MQKGLSRDCPSVSLTTVVCACEFSLYIDEKEWSTKAHIIAQCNQSDVWCCVAFQQSLCTFSPVDGTCSCISRHFVLGTTLVNMVFRAMFPDTFIDAQFSPLKLTEHETWTSLVRDF